MPAAADEPGDAAREAPVDWQALLQSTEGDIGMARELVELFIASGDETLAAIARALRKADYPTVGAQAHSLKGASASLRASAAAAAAARLETAAKSCDEKKVVAFVAEVRREITRTIDFLRAKVASG